MMRIWKKASNDKVPLSLPSRVLGSAFNVIWCGAYIVLILIIIGFTPKGLPWFESAQEDVFASKSYNFVQQFLDKKAPSTAKEIKKVSALIEDPALIKQFQSTQEFEELAEDESLLEILSDEELAEQIQNKEYGKLMSNPKFQSLLNNEDLLKKLFAFNKKIMEESLETNFPESDPNIIDIE